MDRHTAPTPGAFTRRTLVKGAAAAAAATYLVARPRTAYAADAYAGVRSAWLDLLIGPYDTSDAKISAYLSAYGAAAQQLWNTLDTSSTRTSLWSDIASTTNSADLTSTVDRLRTLAIAAASPGGPLYDDSSLIADVSSALTWFLDNRYGAVSTYNNWWDWEIGVPLALNDICVALFAHLSSSQIAASNTAIAHYAPNPATTNGGAATGANLAWSSSIAAVRGALTGSSAPLAAAQSAVAGVFPDVTTGDGFHADGSFVQHTYFAYTGGYGVDVLSSIACLLTALDGTQWAPSAGNYSAAYNWVERNYAPYLYYGASMDMTRGREISRYYTSDHEAGHDIIASILQLAEIAPAAQALAFRQLAKGAITSDSALDFRTFDPLPIDQLRIASIAQAESVVTDSSITAAAESTGHVISPGMARAVHRRPGFAFGISMSSTLIKPYEAINGENLHGWHTGDGMTYLYKAPPSSLSQYSNAYWPTVDPYRLPGITVESLTLSNGAALSTTTHWAGGATVNGLGAVAMSLAAPKTTLTARKAWFCIGDAVVCLGAGVTATDGLDIETIVDNRNIGANGNTQITVDGATVQATPNGAPTVTTNPTWAYIGNTAGYVFPAGGTLNALRADRTGSWGDINSAHTNGGTEYTRRYATLWFDHGTAPSGATYAYIVLPEADATATAAYAANPAITVAANTTAVQAVTDAAAGVNMAIAMQYNAPKAAGIQVDKTAAVITQKTGGVLTIAVADPTAQLTGTINVTVDGAATAVRSAGAGITVTSLSPSVKLAIDMTGSLGKTFTAVLTV
jgi:hyaluronate lyase